MESALTENRRARFDYHILETIEAGIELHGHEVKSVKSGRMNLVASYGVIRGGEAWLLNADIPPYQPRNVPEDYDPRRTRKLLLKKEEIAALTGKLREKGLVLVPLRVYLRRGFLKIELGIGRSKKAHDKRESLKKKAVEREMRRAK